MTGLQPSTLTDSRMPNIRPARRGSFAASANSDVELVYMPGQMVATVFPQTRVK
jgi:hypothetical protein